MVIPHEIFMGMGIFTQASWIDGHAESCRLENLGLKLRTPGPPCGCDFSPEIATMAQRSSIWYPTL